MHKNALVLLRYSIQSCIFTSYLYQVRLLMTQDNFKQNTN